MAFLPTVISLTLLFSLLLAAGETPCADSGLLRLPAGREKALRKSVDAFWSAWKARDYQAAATLVAEQDRSRFHRLRKFTVRGWEIESLTVCRSSPRRAQVVVRVERYEPIIGYPFDWRHLGEWIEHRSGWVLRLPEAALIGQLPHVQEPQNYGRHSLPQ